MANDNQSTGHFWSRFAWTVGVLSAVLGIYVFVNDEIRGRLFPDQNAATRADVKEQLQLSEERIAMIVQASITSAMAGADARGENVSADQQDNYEAALTSLLASEDPTLTDARFLAVSGQAEAAAEKLVTTAETSGASEAIPAQGRADLLRNAGDILVPSDPAKALAAYQKALELDPDNPVLQTRVKKLKAETAEKNAVKAIPGAKFELSGLQFEFLGCENPDAPKCVLSVMNTTPDTVKFWIGSSSAINEQGRWLDDKGRNIVASSHYTWDIPSLEASQIEVTYNRPANIFQLVRFELHVNTVEFNKEFRDIAIRGGRQVDVRAMRPVDPDHPEYAYEVDNVAVHFLGCANPDAPICRFDLMNTGTSDRKISTYGGLAFNSQSLQRKAAQSVLSLSGKSEGELPPGIVTSWDVTFRSPAEFFQAFWPELNVEYEAYPKAFTNLNLGDAEPPAIKTARRDQAYQPGGLLTLSGLEFVFLGCANPDNPTCTFDVHNTTDATVQFRLDRATATDDAGTEKRAASRVIEMTGDQDADIPAGVTTSFEVAFRSAMPRISELVVPVAIGDDRHDIQYADIALQAN
ncbi:hypothetical protein [Hyphomonas oceanitis]|uniref:Tetratricopeptide repeat protein n=1 Tax=Hyphomonas oceanitis SCH89 TaxID=1280953 RepID=A0A059GAY7_9PROT|nr:hypothetical protein [Hyphomonas oceanitis]KDA03653.1 hypothetical protein HOC_04202 [Hyphomonas oceanitis SCH89]